jgi:Protein of unknown function, DUF547
MRRRAAALLLVFGALLTSGAPAPAQTLEAWFAPSAKLWPKWQAQDALSTTKVDHSAWDGLLKLYLRPGADGINRVAYGEVDGAGRQALAGYLDRLQQVAVDKLARAEQLAFWINLYNAATVKVVLDHYPVRSIRDIDISPGLFADGPWDKRLVRVGGEDLTLNDIEHRILRPIWRDPRIHYAVNCASLGCPNLATDAFRGDTADAMLDAAARGYVNHPRGVQDQGGRIIVSKIYLWYGEDFGGSDAAILDHLRRYAAPELRAALQGKSRIDGYEYDWRLNDAVGAAASPAIGR